MKSVVERVKEEHFLLVSYDLTNNDYSDEEQIELPPCSRKSTLLEHIVDYIHKCFPDHTLHLNTTWSGMKSFSEPIIVPYVPGDASMTMLEPT